MNNKIKNYLLKAGWYENREVDISDCIKSFDRDNIKLTDSTISFMKEFYNLKIEFPSEDKRLKGKSIKINMDCHSAIEPKFLNKYNKIYNKTLITIAYCCNYSIIILIDENIKFYIVSEQYISPIGNNLEEMLNNIIHGIFNTKEFHWDEIEDF